jgi:cold shock CspA family protein
MKHYKHLLQGRVRWFNRHFGYGFVRSYAGEDVFVHHSIIGIDHNLDSRLPAHYKPKREFTYLVKNEVVSYVAERIEGRLRATEVIRNPGKKGLQG